MNQEKRLCHNRRLFTVFNERNRKRAGERKEVETASVKIALNRQGVIFTNWSYTYFQIKLTMYNNIFFTHITNH